MNIFETQNRYDSALEFGRAMISPEKENETYSYIYSLINRSDDSYRDTVLPGDPDASVLRNIGPVIVSGGHLEWAIKLDNDHPWKLLWIKYCAYSLLPGGDASWYTVPAAWDDLMSVGAYDQNQAIGENLDRYINVSLSVHGPHGRYIYGGDNVEALRTTDKSPAPIRVFQGYDHGDGQVRIENLLPPQSLILIDIHNTHPTDSLRVAAMLYGLKVRI